MKKMQHNFSRLKELIHWKSAVQAWTRSNQKSQIRIGPYKIKLNIHDEFCKIQNLQTLIKIEARQPAFQLLASETNEP